MTWIDALVVAGSVIVGGLISLGITHWYHLKASAEATTQHEAMRRTTDSLKRLNLFILRAMPNPSDIEVIPGPDGFPQRYRIHDDYGRVTIIEWEGEVEQVASTIPNWGDQADVSEGVAGSGQSKI